MQELVIQSGGIKPISPSTNLILIFPMPTTNGHQIDLTVEAYAPAIQPPTDNYGNTYVPVGNPIVVAGAGTRFRYTCQSISGGPNHVITVVSSPPPGGSTVTLSVITAQEIGVTGVSPDTVTELQAHLDRIEQITGDVLMKHVMDIKTKVDPASV